MRLVTCLLLLISLSACFVVVVDANGNNQNPFLDDGGGDAGLVRAEEPSSSRLAVATRIDYISRSH